MKRDTLKDRALRGSWALLDPEVLQPMVAARLHAKVEAMTPCYVRYKPGTSCIVQYQLSVRDADGAVHQLPAHLKLLADGRAQSQAEGSRAQRLHDRLAEMEPPLRRVAYIPELDGVLQVFPFDLDLRALSRMTPMPAAQGQLRNLLDEPSLDLAQPPELIRYKPGRKALLRYHLAGPQARRVYGKVLAEGRVDRLANQTQALLAGGVCTPEVIGVLAERGVVLHAEGSGDQLASLRPTPDYASWMPPLAESLVHLQGLSVPHLRVHRLADEMVALHQTARLLGQVLPAQRPRLHRLVARLAQGLEAIPEVRRTAHGDFYDDQALVGPDGVTLIDFDELREAHPLLDAGNLLAHLATDPRGAATTGAGHDAFARDVRQRYGASAEEVALFEAVGAMKLAAGPFRRLEPDWEDSVDRMLTLVEQHLAQTSSISAPTAAPEDPMLPQLPVVHDAVAMTGRLSVALQDASLVVQQVDLVRHKPGRRAMLRYHLADGRLLYGKTFASERGPRVHDITRRVCEARAFGDDVALPDPVAWVPELRLLVQRAVPGKPAQEALLAGDADLAQRLAFALYHFHSSGLDLGRRHDLTKELSPLAMRAEAVQQADARLGRMALRLVDQMRDQASGWRWRWRPIHRDLYHEQVLVAGDRLAVVDLDDAAMGEPAVDVANVVAHLMLLGVQQTGDVEALSAVSEAFLAQYGQLDTELDHRLVQFLIGSTLVRLAGIHVGRSNGHQVAQAMLVAAERTVQPLPAR